MQVFTFTDVINMGWVKENYPAHGACYNQVCLYFSIGAINEILTEVRYDLVIIVSQAEHGYSQAILNSAI
jgi:hypothetical protein